MAIRSLATATLNFEICELIETFGVLILLPEGQYSCYAYEFLQPIGNYIGPLHTEIYFVICEQIAAILNCEIYQNFQKKKQKMATNCKFIAS